jgi:hypothetical protein
MKWLYTILFFLDTLTLILLVYFFLKLADNGVNEVTLGAMLFAIVMCIVLLIYILVHYIELPSSKRLS